MIGLYRKKPIAIEAVQWTGDNTREVVGWIVSTGNRATRQWEPVDVDTAAGVRLPRGEHIAIDTLEGTMRVSVGDWIILGVRGEVYPCRADIFEATYEAVDG